MIPTIAELGPIPINSFGLMVALALFVGIERLGLSFRRLGLPSDIAERYVLSAGILGLVGARIWYILTSWDEVRGDLFGAIFGSAGFVFYGGFIAASGVILLMLRKDRIRPSRFFDAVGPSLALGYAIGRLGCQLSGDGDYGIETNSFWGMSYESGVVPTPRGVLVYPTPFFESTIAILIAIILSRIEVSKNEFWSRTWARTGLCLVLIATERFFVEFLRINPRIVNNILSEAQIISVFLAIVGGVLLFRALSLRVNSCS